MWNDWVMIDWGANYGKLPAEIWCYVDFSELPDGMVVNFQGNYLRKGVFAVVESASFDQDAEGNPNCRSDFFIPIKKEVHSVYTDGGIAKRQFHLADVEAFYSPLCVVPDIGADQKLRYFQVVPRNKWADIFMDWLDAPFEEEEAEINTEEDANNPPVDPPKPPKKTRKKRKKAATKPKKKRR